MNFWTAIAGGYLSLLFLICIGMIAGKLFKYFDLHGRFDGDGENVAGVILTFIIFGLLWLLTSAIFFKLFEGTP